MQANQVQNWETEQNFSLDEDKLLEIMRDPMGQDLLWHVLNQEFRDAENEKIIFYWWTAYRIYTQLSWSFFRAMPSDFVVETVFAKQLVMAIILGNDPISELLWYLGLNFTYDEDGTIAEYSRIRDAVFNSQIRVGVWKNQAWTVAHIVDEIRHLNLMKSSSLEMADLKAKTESIFFSQIPNVSYFDRLDIDKAAIVDTFFAFIHFLIGVDPDKVFYMAEILMNGDQYQKEVENEETGGNEEQFVTEDLEVTNTTENYFLSIKKIIDGYFAEGKITDETEVFDYLEKFSTEYNDPRILDLYYYDEQSGKFVWNEELLNSSEQESQ